MCCLIRNLSILLQVMNIISPIMPFEIYIYVIILIGIVVMIENLTNLIIAFGNININNKMIIFAAIVVIGALLYKFMDDWKFSKYYNDMKKQKDKEIERLADDNRRFLEIYLSRLGVDQKQIEKMTATNMKGE